MGAMHAVARRTAQLCFVSLALILATGFGCGINILLGPVLGWTDTAPSPPLEGSVEGGIRAAATLNVVELPAE